VETSIKNADDFNRPLQELVEWFGATTPAVTVNVSAPVVPDVTAVTPEVIVTGQTVTMVVTGTNFAGSTVDVAGDGGVLPGKTVLSITATQIRVSIDASNPLVDGYYGLVIHGTDGDTAVPFRVVPNHPVVDSWTPSQVATGDTYLMTISGANLAGSTVRTTGGVELYDLDTSDDTTITGLLVAGAGTTTQLEVVGRNGAIERVPIEIRARDQITKKLKTLEAKSATGEPVPGIYVEEPAYTEVPVLQKGITFECRFHWERSRSWSRAFVYFRNASTHQRDSNLLNDMSIGEKRPVEALVVIAQGSITFSFDLYCTDFGGSFGLQFNVCLEVEIYVETVGIGSQYLSASACYGSNGVDVRVGGNGFFNFSFHIGSGGGPEGECVKVTPLFAQGQPFAGLPAAEVEMTGCCPEDVNVSGEFFLIDSPQYRETLPDVRAGTAKPAVSCQGDGYHVTVRAFIPVKWVGDPDPLPDCFDGVIPRNLIFKGDARWYDPFPARGRWRIEQKMSEAGGYDISAGQTRAYVDDALADGVLDARDDDATLHDCHLLVDVGTDDSVGSGSSGTHTFAAGVHKWHLIGKGHNPLAPISPAIDWDLTIELDTTVSPPHFKITGAHDCYPGYEVYINGNRIYGYVAEDIRPGDNTNDPNLLTACLFSVLPIPVDGCQGTLGVTQPCGRQ